MIYKFIIPHYYNPTSLFSFVYNTFVISALGNTARMLSSANDFV